MASSGSIPSPTATGGGGEHFEEHVVALALGLLLVRATPPLLKDTSLAEVHLQTRHMGWRTDDLLLVGETIEGRQRKLAIQVKRTFTVSNSNEDCRATFEGMWDDFRAGDRFVAVRDSLAVATLQGTSALLQSFSSLLESARASLDYSDFRRRLTLDGYVSKKARQQNDVVTQILRDHVGEQIDEELYWRFLRSVHVLSYDLNSPTSQTETLLLSLFACCVNESGDPLAIARATWARLIQCASESRPKAASFTRSSLPSELLVRHCPIRTTDSRGLLALVEHGKTVRDGVRTTIGHEYEIDRSAIVAALHDHLSEHQVVIVTGSAGSGKSAIAKRLLDELEDSRPVLAFHAVEFATPHIDQTLAHSQTALNAQSLFGLLAGHDKTVVLVESVERLLEHSVRDAFSNLLQFALSKRSIQLVLTCRDYSLETVRNALLAPIGLAHTVIEVPTLSDDEMDRIQAEVPSLAPPLRNTQIRSLLRTPYVLDMASRLDWSHGATPQSGHAFREKCWKELVRAEQFGADAMPRRRESAFLDIAYQRARALRAFVRPGGADLQALDALHRDSLVECSPESRELFAPAHDVLEDWAILQLLDQSHDGAEDPESALADCVEGYPALRRGLRRWLAERFELDPEVTRALVLRILGREDLPRFFRDDCLVAALLSSSASVFLGGCRSRLEAGDTGLLHQIIRMLRVACKESPRWFGVPGLPSQMLVPAGDAWAPALELVLDLADNLLQDHPLEMLGLVEDWAKQIDWVTSTPAGSATAGLIVERLLGQFDGYRFDDARKRLLVVLLKVPGAVPHFSDLMARARACDRRDEMASELSDMVLGSFDNAYACRDFPSEVIALVNARLRLTEADLSNDWEFASALGVDEVFGIREHGVSEFFPASALQGPYGALLRSHPREAVAFIVDLLNHAGEWYGEQRFPEHRLEPARQITMVIPGLETITQWMNGRMYVLYRGMSVGPYALQSALMALESWLLAVGKMDGVDLELWSLQILRDSNNVMASAVVASVCVAYPAKARRAGLALLSSREIVQYDRNRLAQEPVAALEILTGLNPSHRIFEQERKASNALAHRKEDLESLAVRMQLGDLRQEVWQIIDRHRAQLSADKDEETLVWRLAIHRMDVRGYKPINPPAQTKTDEDSERVYLGPGEIEPEVQTLVDSASESAAVVGRHMGLLNRARKAWENSSSEEAKQWRSLLSEAQTVERELGEPADYCRDGPGLVAAVCIRNYSSDLGLSDLDWCARRIELEVRRHATSSDELIRCSRMSIASDRAAACVVGLLAVDERSSRVVNGRSLLATAITHAVEEVAAYANAGVGAFLTEKHKELILRCAGAAAYWARLTAAARDENAKFPYSKRVTGGRLFDRTAPSVRKAMEGAALDARRELASLTIGDWTSAAATRAILRILGYHPEWQESQTFYSRTASWLAQLWTRNRRDSAGEARRDYELEHEALRAIAAFVLKLSIDDARRVAAPLFDATQGSTREAADFLQQLILSADGASSDCFWEAWQDIADRVTSAEWIERLDNERSIDAPLIDRIFLNTYWREDAKDWPRLAGQAHRLDALAERLPAAIPCLLAYTRFLYTIGQQSLPGAFKVVASVIKRGDATRLASESNIAFYLESMLRRFVYLEPLRLKSDAGIREAVLAILDALVEGGSSSAYRMRDDFVTPVSARND